MIAPLPRPVNAPLLMVPAGFAPNEILPANHRRRGDDDYSVDRPEHAKVVAALRAHADHLPAQVMAGNGVVLFGPPRTGKDRLLIGLARIEIVRHELNAIDAHRGQREVANEE